MLFPSTLVEMVAVLTREDALGTKNSVGPDGGLRPIRSRRSMHEASGLHRTLLREEGRRHAGVVWLASTSSVRHEGRSKRQNASEGLYPRMMSISQD